MHMIDIPDQPDETLELTKFSKSPDGWWWLTCGFTGFGIGPAEIGDFAPEPKAGDQVCLWGAFGRPIRGVAINGAVVFYRTPAEEADRHAKWAAEETRKDMAKFEAARANHDARIAALPPEFRERFAGYQKAGGDAWRAKFEAYELFCCEQAVAAAAFFGTVDKLREFHKLDPGQQREAWPAFSGEHSGNTYGHMLTMARVYLTQPANVPKWPGGMAPLVGSEEMHDWSTRPENAEEVAALTKDDAE